MQVFSINNQEFWIKLWQDARNNFPMARRRCRTEEELVDFWNKRAQWFTGRTSGERGQQRLRAVLSMLEQEGALGAEFKVLDIGAGPGNFALPLARIVEHVTALEPSGEMMKILKDRVKTNQVDNITFIQRTWQDVQVDEEGLAGQYDLVFASKSPGVQDPETLQKMIAASRKFCYYSGFSGQRWGRSHRELWQRLFHEDMGDNPKDIMYPFGLLYSMGYRPSLRFITTREVQEQPVEKAVENLLQFFWSYTDILPQVRQEVENYVAEHSQNGLYREVSEVCHGMMLWRVD
ncbi:class I SAM-dependent methyltransferase [Desulfolucanica intricata]|uniref:class I SAM-dependent methyltransferase n=1 Tax=Desulfolucanica intricata TaxID=1285191 RepID=UPI0008342F75|nr:class I SAM-dependent methyltransferase [Desulfolucanica intricata]